MSDGLLELIRHKTWATLQLIEACRQLTEAELDTTTPGTFGSIRSTLHHLVAAEERFFWTLARANLQEPLADGQESLLELAARIRAMGPAWEAMAQDPELQRRVLVTRTGWHVAGAIVMAQAVYHAGDHRTHVLSILGAQGMPVPDLDVWSYAQSAQLMFQQADRPD